MSATSTPTVQPVPSQAAYGIDVLKLLKEYDRAGYAEAFGVDPPTYDPTLPTKGWFDSSADPSQAYTYESYVFSGPMSAPAAKNLSISGAWAAAVNIYGVHTYPAYVIEPTLAATVDSTGVLNSPVPAVNLSTQAQANSLAIQLGLTSAAVLDGSLVNGIFRTVYQADEDRKIWLISFKGVQVNAGMLAQEQNYNGAGAPGRWDLSGPEPNWISLLPSLSSLPPANPVQPVPMRPLNPNEQFVVTLAGVTIGNTSNAPPAPSGSGSGLTSDQAALLSTMAAGIAKIMSWFHIA